MRIRHIVPVVAVLLACLVGTSTASASYRVAVGDQSPQMFDSPAWQALGLTKTRYIVPWDWDRDPAAAGTIQAYLTRAQAANVEVLVAFTATSGCYVNGKYAKSKACRAPSRSAYSASVKRFVKAFPQVKRYTPWNEANHVSQPTHGKPALAYRYYAALKRAAGSGRTVLAADVLDQSDLASYLRGYLRASKGKGKVWGLHNYKDVNRFYDRGVKTMAKTVRGQIWLTETGPITTFLPSFATSSSRPVRAVKQMFSLAGKWDSKRRGYRSKVTRLYTYRWFGEGPGARFDAGLVNPDGTPRPAFAQFQKGLASAAAKP